jgi:hypothetical protein
MSFVSKKRRNILTTVFRADQLSTTANNRTWEKCCCCVYSARQTCCISQSLFYRIIRPSSYGTYARQILPLTHALFILSRFLFLDPNTHVSRCIRLPLPLSETFYSLAYVFYLQKTKFIAICECSPAAITHCA